MSKVVKKPEFHKGKVKTVEFPIDRRISISNLLKIIKTENLDIEKSNLNAFGYCACDNYGVEVNVEGTICETPPTKEELKKYYTDLLAYFDQALEDSMGKTQALFKEIEKATHELNKLSDPKV
jgi:hypothetical protein